MDKGVIANCVKNDSFQFTTTTVHFLVVSVKLDPELVLTRDLRVEGFDSEHRLRTTPVGTHGDQCDRVLNFHEWP